MAKITYKHESVDLGSLTFEENVRIGDLLLRELADDIAVRGIITPPIIWADPKVEGQYIVCQGNRRGRALKLLHDVDIAAFKNQFPDGKVPVSVMYGASRRDFDARFVDHGNELGLRDPHELVLCGIKLFKSGCSEQDAAVILNGLITRIIGGLKGKRKAKVADLEQSLELAEESGKAERVKTLKANIEREISEARRGTVQHIKHVFRCPPKVTAALLYKSTGVVPEGYREGELPVNLTNAQVTKLDQAMTEDAGDANADINYDAGHPGPAFIKAWEKLVQAAKTKVEEKADPATRAKAMTGQQLDEQIPTLISNFGKGLTRQHRGLDTAPTAEEIATMDATCQVAEILKEFGEPGLWDECIATAQSIKDLHQEKVKNEVATKA